MMNELTDNLYVHFNVCGSETYFMIVIITSSLCGIQRIAMLYSTVGPAWGFSNSTVKNNFLK